MAASRTLWLALAVGLAAAGLLGWWGSRPPEAPARVPQRDPEPPPAAPVRREVPPSVAPEPVPTAQPRKARQGSPAAELNDRGIAALNERRFEEATALFTQCVELAPDEPVFKGNLAEALVRRAVDEHERVRPCEPCIEWLARAVALAPERDSLAKLLARWRAELETEKEFLRDRSVHFELSYDGWRQSLLDAAPDVLDELERHYTDLELVFALSPGERGQPRIPVSLYRREEFARITGLSEWAGGSFDGTIRVPIAEGRALDAELSALLRHELVHAFVRAAGGVDVPAWLNEGLAQWLHPSPAAELAAARRRSAGQALIPLERLERPFASLGQESEIALAYAQSLLFVEFLERQHGRDALLAMVRGAREGRSAAAAFEAWTRLPLALAREDFAAELAR